MYLNMWSHGPYRRGYLFHSEAHGRHQGEEDKDKFVNTFGRSSTANRVNKVKCRHRRDKKCRQAGASYDAVCVPL